MPQGKLSVEVILDKLYEYYGTDSGVLFGLPFSEKPIVEVIVKAILLIQDEGERGGL